MMKEITRHPMYRYLLILTISSTAGLHGWRTLFDNFAVRVVGLEGSHVGLIQSVREIPGFLALLAIYVMLVIREHRLSALSVLVLGIGVSLTGFFPSLSGLIATTLIFSFGFHYFETTNQSLTLQYFDRTKSPLVFGRLRSISAATNIAVGLMIYFIAPHISFKYIYLLIGGFIALTAVMAMSRHPTRSDAVPQHKKMIFRKRYWLYYLLTILSGARRQVFVAFAVFLLVKRFNYTLQEVTLLFVINNIVNYFLSPMIGRAIVKFGERRVMSLEYASLVLIFISYALVDSRIVVALLYILDHVFFNFAIAIRTYFQKIGDAEDIAPSMAVGFTLNHLAAVILPVIGGILWMIDYRIPFLIGAVFSLISLTAVQMIRTTK